MNLSERYRPEVIDHYYAEESFIDSFKAVFERQQDKRPKTYLFHGLSGTGKTTLARIAAKEFLKASDNDIIEMNTANYRGIDAVRAMLQRVGLKPVAGSEARVYILDECHQMTKDAQNALLKALEDSANTQTYFMLCTTEPGKLEKTIVNRAIQFETKPLSSELMGQLIFDIHVEYMHDVTETDDSPTLPDAVIDAIVEKAEGSPRLALNILDKVIDLPQEKMITAIDSFAQQEQYGIDLAKLLINGCKWSDVQKLLKELQDDPESARRVVMGYANGVLVKSTSAKIQARAFVVLDAFKDPFYNMGKPGLTYATYLALNS